MIAIFFLAILAAADRTPPPSSGAFFYSTLEVSAGFDPPFLYLPMSLGATTAQIASGPKYNITNIDKTNLKANELKNGYLQTIATQELRLTVNEYPTVLMTTECATCSSVVGSLSAYNPSKSSAFNVTAEGVVFGQRDIQITA